ncbi:hypothetical protein TNCV_2722281 [Trichonephila clavipes]|nr:hypothetical protein TNCV_2722281 [Trichonephila clavipes]
MVLKANDRRTSSPCHDEFRGPRSDCVRQWYWARNRDKASHGPIPWPIDYRGLQHVKGRTLSYDSLPSVAPELEPPATST